MHALINRTNCNLILVRLAWNDSGTNDVKISASTWPNCGGANGNIIYEENLLMALMLASRKQWITWNYSNKVWSLVTCRYNPISEYRSDFTCRWAKDWYELNRKVSRESSNISCKMGLPCVGKCVSRLLLVMCFISFPCANRTNSSVGVEKLDLSNKISAANCNQLLTVCPFPSLPFQFRGIASQFECLNTVEK